MEKLCADLSAELVRRQLAVAVVIPEQAKFDAMAESCRQFGAEVTRLDTDARSGRIEQARRWGRLVRLFRTWRPDIVHLNTGGATGGLGVVAAVRATTSATVIVTEHDIPKPNPTWHQRLARQAMDQLSHTVLAISRKTADARRERLPTSALGRKLGAVPIGIPIREVPPDVRSANRQRVRQEFGIEDDALVIGTVVRLAPGKGVADLINAFALVTRACPCHLLMVGDGPLRPALEAQVADLGLRDRVHFAGFQADPLPFLDGMDVFALATLIGSGSVALLEAMAHGLPSVITFGGPEEAVISGVTGLIAPPSNVPELARQLLQLVRDSALRERLGTAGAAYVRCKFTIARVADDLLDLYAAPIWSVWRLRA